MENLGYAMTKIETYGLHQVFGNSSDPEGILEYISHVSWNIRFVLNTSYEL